VKRAAAAVLAVVAIAAPAAASAADRYVALGDSYASGVGTGSYTLSSSCKRSVYAYPYLVAQQRGDTSLVFVACSGATTADVVANQLGSVDSATTIVTITVGGNDIRFADLIYQCTLSDCSATLDSTRSSLESTLGARLDSLYAAIKQRAAAAAKIIVVGYPRIFNGSSCFGNLGISAAERTKANQLADTLDQTIAAHAATAGVTYRSATAAFGSHPVCSLSPWVSGLNLFATMESYHPNRNGQSLGYVPLVRAVTG
jgi:lysophospholipase L1-like esterase